jgi:hypothetical protein
VLAILLAVALSAGAAPALAADPVQRIEVHVGIDGGEPHPLVVRRIVESIGTAAERLLVGRDSDLVGRQEAALGGILRDVVDRVVTGYRVVSVGLQAGTATVVTVRLEPRSAVLGETPVIVEIPGVHPEVQPLVRATLEPAMADLRRLPVRLPVDALGWAGPILEDRMVEIVQETLGGFAGSARLQADPVARITLTISAKDSRVIRDIGVRFRSTSIPSLLLQGHAPQVASMAEPLRGLPVVFAQAQRARLEALISSQLAAYPPVRDYAILARPVLQIAEVTTLTVLAESSLYRGRVEARLNFGTQAPPTDVRAHLGRAFGSLEPFVEVTLIPSNLTWHTALGAQFEVGPKIILGAKTRFDATGVEPFVTIRLSPDLQIGGTYTPSPDTLEGTLSYRVNEFFSWEAVATSRGVVWLRIVGNL